MNLNAFEAAISDDRNNETRDIVFPHQSEDISQIAVDVGGSLAKIVWFSKHTNVPGGRLNFMKFETQHIQDCISFVEKILHETENDSKISKSQRVVVATGGGAHKFYDLFKDKLQIHVQKEDEMECLITGLNFLVRQIPYEVFTYDERRTDPIVFESTPSELFPYLLVNIGSGVSVLKVTSDETFERISGTSIGGGTLWGLLSLMTNARTYDEMLEVSKDGDNKNVDMLVGDIYGGDYNKIGLKSTTIASSFGKVFKKTPEERAQIAHADISRSLLFLVSNNIGQIAYLNAQAHGIQRIYFSGFFIRGHPITMNTLSYAINFWSKGKIKAMFLRHEGYLGAMGAFIRHTPRRARIGSFTENFSQIEKISSASPAVGTLDTHPVKLTEFSLLSDSEAYQPDTQDLSDSNLQKYWIDILDQNLSNLVELALECEGQGGNSGQRAATFEAMYRDHLQALRTQPNLYGVMTVRSLLNLREQCLQEMGFHDIFENLKKRENLAALKELGQLLFELGKLSERERILSLLDNVLTGNMFDWSTAVQSMLKKGELDFKAARAKVGYPEKFDNRNHFIDRLMSKPPYRKVVICVDNSGADIVLGVLPLARYFLEKGTIVVLAANTKPSVNDVTHYELEDILSKLDQIDPLFATNRRNNQLVVVETGSTGPCLGWCFRDATCFKFSSLFSSDFRWISEGLQHHCRNADLIIIEGMGRAIHTNFFAKFKVDSLKIAVFKNPAVAEYLGANMYDAICIFEPKS
ncbi:fumble-domain-containing protein [Cladochytrium replicatum]|nr:fumble-domain-containing protein [Cladochytrium replicatum]